MHSCGMSKDGCYYQIDCSHKLGRENVWKVFAVEKKKVKNGMFLPCGLARLAKTSGINVAVEQQVAPHEKSFSKGTKAILFYLCC